jgi:hypothetical protein
MGDLWKMQGYLEKIWERYRSLKIAINSRGNIPKWLPNELRKEEVLNEKTRKVE